MIVNQQTKIIIDKHSDTLRKFHERQIKLEQVLQQLSVFGSN